MNQRGIVTRALAALGFEVIFWNENPNAPGVDCWAQRPGKRPVSVEVKLLKRRNGSLICEPVSDPRKQDDLVAIIVNENYAIVEPMKDHLKCCAPKGTRSFPFL